MRAAIFRDGQITVGTVPDPVPEQGQVLVKTLRCGICGSDLHAAKHTRQFVDLARRSGGRWGMDPERDLVFGHEFCCEIVEYGPDTPKRLKPGTLVCSMPMTLLGDEVLGIGYNSDIAGGYGQFMPLADRMLAGGAERAICRTRRPDRTHRSRMACGAIRPPRGRRCALGDRLRSGRAGSDLQP